MYIYKDTNHWRNESVSIEMNSWQQNSNKRERERERQTDRQTGSDRETDRDVQYQYLIMAVEVYIMFNCKYSRKCIY